MFRAHLALAALLCLAVPARSDWVTLHFDGVAEYASGTDLARLGLSPGAAVSGTVRYQTSYLNLLPQMNDVASFQMPGLITLRAGGHTFTAAALGPSEPWMPYKPGGDHQDYMNAAIRIPGLPGGRTEDLESLLLEDLESLELSVRQESQDGASWLGFHATFNRADGAPVGDLPTDPAPFVGGAGRFSVRIYGPDPDRQGAVAERLFLAGPMVATATTPEPGALVLAGLGTGAGLLAWVRHFRRRGLTE